MIVPENKEQMEQMNDVLIVERLITAYNSMYSVAKSKNYKLNEQTYSSFEDKMMQCGMERIVSQVVRFKFEAKEKRFDPGTPAEFESLTLATIRQLFLDTERGNDKDINKFKQEAKEQDGKNHVDVEEKLQLEIKMREIEKESAKDRNETKREQDNSEKCRY